MQNTITTEEMTFLFEEHVRLTDCVEYGFSMQDLVERTKPIPPEGARFDIYFEGELTGETVNGRVSGVDYLEVRADGRFFLNLEARIETNDGASIKLTETGVNNQGALKLNMTFHTNDERYTWLNNTQVYGVGYADFSTGTAGVKAYII